MSSICGLCSSGILRNTNIDDPRLHYKFNNGISYYKKTGILFHNVDLGYQDHCMFTLQTIEKGTEITDRDNPDTAL